MQQYIVQRVEDDSPHWARRTQENLIQMDVHLHTKPTEEPLHGTAAHQVGHT